MQRTRVKTYCTASTQEKRVNPSVSLGAAVWSAAAESATLQKKVSFLVTRMSVCEHAHGSALWALYQS